VTIHPRPDQERQIQEAMQAGVIHSAEDVIDVGLEHLRRRLPAVEAAAQVANAENLVDLFANSPFAGTNMDFERDQDVGRDLDL
jgi:uncharacterized protein (DUF2267 family)